MATATGYNLIPLPVLVGHKALAFGLLMLSVVILTSQQIFTQYAVLAHGHFLLGYWYQYKTGKFKPSVKSFGLYGIALAVCVVVLQHFPSQFIYITAVAFALHFLLDEFVLNTERLTVGAALMGLPVLLILAVGFYQHQFVAIPQALREAELGQPMVIYNNDPGWLGQGLSLDIMPAMHQLMGPMLAGWMPVFWASFGLAVLLFFVHLWRERRVHVFGLTMLVISAMWLLMMPGRPILDIRVLLGIIVMMHGINWYLGYDYKLRKNPQWRHVFWREIAIINVVIIGAFALCYSLKFTQVQTAFFGFSGYHVWAMMHILTTIRRSDYGTLGRGVMALVGRRQVVEG